MEAKIDSPDPQRIPGEICVRGEHVMKGYYKNPEATRQVIDEEGWLHTGDIGTMNEDNTLFIKGRSKSMILSANGQNIYPEEIESKLNNMSCVLESLVVERDGKLVALVYPDYEQADEAGISYSDIQRVMDENKGGTQHAGRPLRTGHENHAVAQRVRENPEKKHQTVPLQPLNRS